MKKVFFFLSGLLSCFSAYAGDDDIGVPYAGINTQVRQIEFKGGYGSNIFAKRMPQAEIYGGFKINSYLGFELAYLRSLEAHKTAQNANLNNYFGIDLGSLGVPSDFYERATASSRIDGGSVNVVGSLPVTEDLQFLGSLGIARLRVKLKYVPVGDNATGYTPAQTFDNTKHYAAWRYVPQAKVGVQYMVSQAVGLKALLGWDGTSRFNLIPNRTGEFASTARVSLKDSYNLGLGLAYYFK